MSNFDIIKNDQTIMQLYDKISEFENLNNGWAHHNFQHVINVVNLVEKLLSDLNYNKNFIEEAKIAAILHDTGCINGKSNHALKSYEYAKKYLEEKNLDLQYCDLILEAIKIHSDGFDTDNIIALTLILSDKLDIKHTRIAKAGYNIPGMKEIQFINDILVKIHNNILEINFICDDKINKQTLEEYYFTSKVFKAIKAFSKKLNLTPIVLFNSKKWKKFEEC